jgi:hypothetical protein
MSAGAELASAGRPQAREAAAPARAKRSGLGLRSPHAIVGLLCAAAIAFGSLPGVDLDLTPSAGLGYALGIAGLAAMTVLLGYSLRKRARWLRDAGPIRRWLEIHLVLGLLGPTAILYHADFELGSLNSTVSMMCVLLVAGSGVGGRFLYGRMHRSLAGPRRTTDAYHRHAAQEIARIEDVLSKVPEAGARLRAFADAARQPCPALLLPLRFVVIRAKAFHARWSALRAIARRARPRPVPRELRNVVATIVSDLRRGFELRLFERLFALWHAIHVPLTVLLFVSAALHVVAVHLF